MSEYRQASHTAHPGLRRSVRRRGGYLIAALVAVVSASAAGTIPAAWAVGAIPVAVAVGATPSAMPAEPMGQQARAGHVLAWIHLDGGVEPLGFEPARFSQVRLAPDERRVALVVGGPDGPDIWIYGLDNGVVRRFTSEGNNGSIVWAPDGESIYFRSDRSGDTEIWRKRLDPSATAELLLARPGEQSPWSISSDGGDLWYYEDGDIYRLRLDRQEGQPEPMRTSAAATRFPAVSDPGGSVALVAFQVSGPDGREGVVLGDFADGSDRVVCSGWCLFPSWADDGRTLYFLSRDADGNGGLYTVAVSRDPGGFTFSEPEVRFRTIRGSRATYDVTADGSRLLMAVPADAGGSNRGSPATDAPRPRRK